MVMYGEKFVYGKIQHTEQEKRVAQTRASYALWGRAQAQQFARTRAERAAWGRAQARNITRLVREATHQGGVNTR